MRTQPADIQRGIITQLQGERMARGWSAADAAQHIGMSVANYEAVENGMRDLSLPEFIRFCLSLQTHPRYLFAAFKDSDFGGQDDKPGTTLHDVARGLM